MSLFGKKTKANFEVVAPISGKVIPLDDVNDDVFAQHMMGQGFAVTPSRTDDVVVAPVDGKVIMLPETRHAVGLQATYKNAEILVHIGLDTVSLSGKGFKALVKQDAIVKAGTPLVQVNWQVMDTVGLDLTTMVIFTAGYDQPIALGALTHHDVKAGQALLRE